MPGNVIKINNSDALSWYVGDSKMNILIGFLNKVGHKDKKEKKKRTKDLIG